MDVSDKDETVQKRNLSNNIVLCLMKNNTSGGDVDCLEGGEVGKSKNNSLGAEIGGKDKEGAASVQRNGDEGISEKACQEEEKRRREQERRKEFELMKLRKDQKRREEEERKRAKREEKWKEEQEAKAREEEAQALEEEARVNAEAEESRRREQRELEELAGMLRQSLEVEEAERQVLAEEEEMRLMEGVVEATRKEKKRKMAGERSRRPTMAREWRMVRQRRRSQEQSMAKVESDSSLLSNEPTHDSREHIIIEQNAEAHILSAF